MARATKKKATANTTWSVATYDARPVYVTGSIKELGEWNPTQALPMQHGGRGPESDQWNISLTIPQGQEIEFKFIHRGDDGSVDWEVGDNRVYTVGEGDSAAEWGYFRYS